MDDNKECYVCGNDCSNKRVCGECGEIMCEDCVGFSSNLEQVCESCCTDVLEDYVDRNREEILEKIFKMNK